MSRVATLAVALSTACACTARAPAHRASSDGSPANVSVELSAHRGADQLIVSDDIIASSAAGETVVVTRRSGSGRVAAPGRLVGVDRQGRAVILQREPGGFALARLGLDGELTRFARLAFPVASRDSPTPAVQDAEVVLESAPRRVVVTATALSGPPETVAVALAGPGVHESWLMTFDADGRELYRRRRLGSEENFEIAGLVADSQRSSIAVLIREGADRPELARPTSLMSLDPRTGKTLWMREYPERWSADDGALAIDASGSVAVFHDGRFRRVSADGIEQTDAPGPDYGHPTHFVLSPDGTHAVAVVRVVGSRDMGGGAGGCRTVVLDLQGQAEALRLRQGASDADCPPLGAGYDRAGRLWVAP